MADLEKVKRGLECCKAFLCKDGKCPYYGSMCQSSLATDALELLKELKNLIDGLIEDQLKKDEEQQAEIERLKAELNQYHKADAFLAVHGWQWKDDGTEHHTEQLKDGEQD